MRISNNWNKQLTSSDFYTYFYSGTRNYETPPLSNDYSRMGSRGYHDGEPHLFRLSWMFNQEVGTIKRSSLIKEVKYSSGVIDTEPRQDTLTTSYDVDGVYILAEETDYLQSLAYCTHFGGEQFLMDVPSQKDYRHLLKGVSLGRLTSLSFTQLTTEVEDRELACQVAFTIEANGSDRSYLNSPLTVSEQLVPPSTQPINTLPFSIKAENTNICDSFVGVLLSEDGLVSIKVFDPLLNKYVTASETINTSSYFEGFYHAVGQREVVFVGRDVTETTNQINYVSFNLMSRELKLYSNNITGDIKGVVHYKGVYYIAIENSVFSFFPGSPFKLEAAFSSIISGITTDGYHIFVVTNDKKVYVTNGSAWELKITNLDLVFPSANLDVVRGIYSERSYLHILTQSRLYIVGTSDYSAVSVSPSGTPISSPISQISRYRNQLVTAYKNAQSKIISYDLSNGAQEVLTSINAVIKSVVSHYETLHIGSDDDVVIAIRSPIESNNKTAAITNVLWYKRNNDSWRFVWDFDEFHQVPNIMSSPNGTGGYPVDNAYEPSAIETTGDFSVDNSEGLVSSRIFGNQDYNSGIMSVWAVYMMSLDRRYFNSTAGYKQLFTLKGSVGDYEYQDDGRVKLQFVSEATNFDRRYEFKTQGTCLWEFGSRQCGFNFNGPGGRQTEGTATIEFSPSVIDINPYLSFALRFNFIPSYPGVLSSPPAVAGLYKFGKVKFTTGKNAGISIPLAVVVETGLETPPVIGVRLAYPAPYPLQTGDLVTISPGCNKSREACKSYSNQMNFSGFYSIMGAGVYQRGTNWVT